MNKTNEEFEIYEHYIKFFTINSLLTKLNYWVSFNYSNSVLAF